MRPLLAALSFLTILPLPRTGEDDLRNSGAYFPVVGVIIGGMMAILAWGLTSFFPPLPRAALMTIALLAISKGLHLDGLSDTADGFLSSRPRERILAIMKDSHLGAMGGMAIVAIFGLKVSALASISNLPLAVFLMPVAGRCAITLMNLLLPYVRPEGGLGGLFRLGHPRLTLLFTLAVLFGSSALAGGAGMVAAGGTVLVVLGFAVICRRTIGGMTGDTLGAACEIAETAMALLLCSVWMR